MSASWIGFIAFLAIVIMLLGSISVGYALTDNGNVTGPLKSLTSYAQVWTKTDWGTLVYPQTHIRFFSDLLTVMIGGPSIYSIYAPGSPWLIVWWIIMLPVVATVVFGITMVFVGIIQRIIS